MTAPTAGIVGEAGPEAIVPLSGADAAGLELGGVSVNLSISGNTFGENFDPGRTFREFAEKIAYEVRRVIADEHRRSAVI